MTLLRFALQTLALQTLTCMRAPPCVAAILLLSLTGAALAEDPSPAKTGVATPSVEELAIPNGEQKDTQTAVDAGTRESICLMLEAAARANDLPLEFFARVIWQESRFQSDAVGPVTRNGQRAQGIAQFMPGTANERRLLDPFDPVQALPKSAEFLSELRNQFGNLGLAAAAYNAGPRRVQEWLSGAGPMPQETPRETPRATIVWPEGLDPATFPIRSYNELLVPASPEAIWRVIIDAATLTPADDGFSGVVRKKARPTSISCLLGARPKSKRYTSAIRASSLPFG